MIIFLVLIYAALLFLLIKTGKVPNSSATWLTIIPYIVLLLVALFIPMQWGAPAGKASVLPRASRFCSFRIMERISLS